MQYPKFVEQVLSKINKGETYKFKPAKLAKFGGPLTEDMLRAITLMVNTGKPVDMPKDDTSAACVGFDPNPKRQVIGIFFRLRENDKDADADNEEQHKQRGEVLVLLGDVDDIKASAKYSAANSSDDPGSEFGEWAQGMGFPSDLWGPIGTLLELSFRDPEQNFGHGVSDKILAKYDVGDFEVMCPWPTGEESEKEEKAMKEAHMDGVWFYKSEE